MASVGSPLSSESEGELFEVENILGKRTRHGKVEYLVRWKGFNQEEDSWEPVKNLQGCQSLIKKFSKTRSPSPGRKARTPKIAKVTQQVQVQPKKEVEPADEEYTKLKTPETTKPSDYLILRRRRGQLASQNEAKEEKEQVVITTKVETVKEETVKQKESVAKELPTQSSPVKEAPPPPTTGKQEVLKVFAALIVFLFFALLLLSFVRGVGDVKN